MHSVMEDNPNKERGVSEGLLGGNRKCFTNDWLLWALIQMVASLCWGEESLWTGRKGGE